MPFFTFTLHHTVVRGAAQYNHCLLLVATGSCPVQNSWRVTASLPSRFLSGSLTSLWFCFLCPSVCSVFHPSSSFVFFHPSLFLSLHLSVLFFPFILSRFLSPSPAVPHGLYLPLSLSVSITFSSLPYPFVSPKASFLIGFVFLLACLARSASVWVLFPPPAPLLVSQIPPVRPCYASVAMCWPSNRTLQRLDAPRVLDPGSHH